jgi:hypothetical protein
MSGISASRHGRTGAVDLKLLQWLPRDRASNFKSKSGAGRIYLLERFRAKWIPVRVKKTRQNKRIEPGSDSIRTDKALEPLLFPKFV